MVKRRDRQVLSCQSCHLRKKKCDREKPCQQCKDLNKADQCVYISSSNDISRPNTSGASVSKSNKPSPTYSTTSTSSVSPQNSSSVSSVGSNGSAATTVSSTSTSGSSSSSSMRNPKIPRFINHRDIKSGTVEGVMATLGYAENTNPDLVRVVAELKEENLRKTLQDIPELDTTVAKLIQNLPPKSTCMALVDSFFLNANWGCSVIQREDYMVKHNRHIGELRQLNTSDALRFHNGCSLATLAFLGLLYRIMSLSIQYQLSSDGPQSEFLHDMAVAPQCSQWLYDELANKVAAISCDTVPNETLIEERLLAVGYVKNQGNMRRAWMITGLAMRTAQSISMDDEKMATAHQKFLWCSLRAFDAQMSLILGRKSVMCGVPLPDYNPPPDTPVGQDGCAPLFKIAVVSVKISEMDATDADEVRRIEELIEEVTTKWTPVHLQIGGDTQYDLTHTYLPAQRLALRMCQAGIMAALHRSSLDANRKTACSIEKLRKSTIEVLKLAHSLVTNYRQYAPAMPIFHTFDAAFMTCLCSLNVIRQGGDLSEIYESCQLVDQAIQDLTELSGCSILANNGRWVLEQVKQVCERERKELGEVERHQEAVKQQQQQQPQKQQQQPPQPQPVVQQQQPQQPQPQQQNQQQQMYQLPMDPPPISMSNFEPIQQLPLIPNTQPQFPDEDYELMKLLGLSSSNEYKYPYFILES